MDNWFKVASLRQWLNGVIIQGRRLFEVHSNTMLMMQHSSPQRPIDMVAFHKMMDIVRVEEYFFIIAINKARVWLYELKDLREFQSHIREFNSLLPYVQEIRDMREHEINYFGYAKKQGKKQENFHRSVGEPGTIVADASSTIVNGNEYLIGGRLNVQVAISMAAKILPTVQARFDKLSNEKLPD